MPRWKIKTRWPINSAGFTLMEIIVATTIFSILFVSLLSLFNYTLKINRRSEALRQASQGMRDFAESLVKQIRGGRIDYGVIDPDGSVISPAYPVGPCFVPSDAVSDGTATYASKENKLGLINTDNVQECIYFGDQNGNYVDPFGSTPTTFSSNGASYTLVLQKVGLPKQILNPPNVRIEKLMFLIRPTKDPYVTAGGLIKVSPSVSILMQFITQLPTGETVNIYYQTSVSTNQYDIPNN